MADTPPNQEDATSTPKMTTRYTDEEWRTFITDTERNIRISDSPYPCPKPEKLARTIDHTLLKLTATSSQIDALCAEARVANFAVIIQRR